MLPPHQNFIKCSTYQNKLKVNYLSLMPIGVQSVCCIYLSTSASSVNLEYRFISHIEQISGQDKSSTCTPITPKPNSIFLKPTSIHGQEIDITREYSQSIINSRVSGSTHPIPPIHTQRELS